MRPLLRSLRMPQGVTRERVRPWSGVAAPCGGSNRRSALLIKDRSSTISSVLYEQSLQKLQSSSSPFYLHLFRFAMARDISGNMQLIASHPEYPSPTSIIENMLVQAMKLLTLPPLWSRKVYYRYSVPRIKSIRSRTQRPQQQSRLLALPLELRIMIWNFVFQNDSMTLLWKHGKVKHYFVQGIGDSCFANFKPKMPHWYRSTREDEEHQLLALLHTCHAM